MGKELEALHTIAFNTSAAGMNFGNELRTIERTLLKSEEQEKVLDVIITKRVDVDYFMFVCETASGDKLEAYNNRPFGDSELTQEEFDLLEEMIYYA